MTKAYPDTAVEPPHPQQDQDCLGLSTNLLEVHSIPSSRTLIKIFKRTASITEPWGKTCDCLPMNLTPFTTTFWAQPLSQLFILLYQNDLQPFYHPQVFPWWLPSLVGSHTNDVRKFSSTQTGNLLEFLFFAALYFQQTLAKLNFLARTRGSNCDTSLSCLHSISSTSSSWFSVWIHVRSNSATPVPAPIFD